MENSEVKRPYEKPDFEVIELEDTPKLLSGSNPLTAPDGAIGG